MTTGTSDHNIECQRCDASMNGIGHHSIRRYCEACGGNKTEFNAENPNPEGFVARDRAAEAARNE